MTVELGYLGLGANLGDRRATLEASVEMLWTHGVQAIASSSVYATEPVGEVTDQPEFLNACVAIETALGPEALLDACKAVESALGRGEIVRHGPRVIDIDVLLLGTREYESERISVPHPEVAARRFVLVPLLELDPNLALPDGTPLADALASVEGQAVEKVGPPLEVRASD
jgi:2-amino-4-hydroxy-6-hydroxymethyldihydropteridine diphosphokinase